MAAPGLLSLLASALASPAAATGYDVDIELIRPTFSQGSLAGVDSPTVGEVTTVRVGTLAQFARDPLVVYEEGFEIGAAVARRATAHLGVDVAASDRLALRLILPMAAQWGSEVEALSADGFGVGDVSFGARVMALDLDRVTAGVRGDLMLPTGRDQAYMGELGLRGVFGALAMVDAGPVEVLADASVTGREAIETAEDFTLGTELSLNLGVRYPVWEDRIALSGALVTRGGATDLFQGGAENTSEALGGLELRPKETLSLNLGLGRGLADGYGSTELRGLAGLTWTFAPPPPAPPEPEPVAVIETIMPEPEPDPPPDPEPEPPAELARVVQDQIVIRDPIQFELGTARILPESKPVLEAVAELMQERGEIGMIVIEGHASEEGSFEYNYRLSTDRAQSVYEALFEAGVNPYRMAFRGMGEVVPVSEGDDEEALALNRRVDFHITHQLAPGEPPPAHPTEMDLPWTGAPIAVPIPAPPEPPPEPPKPTPEPGDRFDPDEFLDEDDFDFGDETDDALPTEGAETEEAPR